MPWNKGYISLHDILQQMNVYILYIIHDEYCYISMLYVRKSSAQKLITLSKWYNYSIIWVCWNPNNCVDTHYSIYIK
jgi:hypothetical protein